MTALHDAYASGFEQCFLEHGVSADTFEKEAGFVGRTMSSVGGGIRRGIAGARAGLAADETVGKNILKQHFNDEARRSVEALRSGGAVGGAYGKLSPTDVGFHQGNIIRQRSDRMALGASKPGQSLPNQVREIADRQSKAQPVDHVGSFMEQLSDALGSGKNTAAQSASSSGPGWGARMQEWMKARPDWQKYTAAGVGGGAVGLGAGHLMSSQPAPQQQAPYGYV